MVTYPYRNIINAFVLTDATRSEQAPTNTVSDHNCLCCHLGLLVRLDRYAVHSMGKKLVTDAHIKGNVIFWSRYVIVLLLRLCNSVISARTLEFYTVPHAEEIYVS